MILVIDFGGQYTQLIAKAIRSQGVYSEIAPYPITADQISDEGIVLSGGPESVYDKNAPKLDPNIFELGLPVLGICYGMHLIHQKFGGIIQPSKKKELWETWIDIDTTSGLFCGLPSSILSWMSHGDSVANPAEGFSVLAKSSDCIASISHGNIYGVQFHPEVTHMPLGKKIIHNFVRKICKCDANWNMKDYMEKTLREIQNRLGAKDSILSFVSGGVDSSFVTILLSKLLKARIYPVYIEAFQRKGEAEEVEKSLKEAGVKKLLIVRQQERFIEAVRNIQDPEEKRKAIGEEFGKVLQDICMELNLDPEHTFLAQGTLYTDLIESGKGVGKAAHTIKSHHNVGCPFIDALKKANKLIEPNQWIFKDEVRKCAKEIEVPEQIYSRHPYPGPGLAILIVNGKEGWKSEKISENEYILPIKTVGVEGDQRSYSFLGLLRGERKWSPIRQRAQNLIKKCRLNSVVFDLPSQSDLNPELIPIPIDKKNLSLLQEIDFFGKEIIRKHGFEKKISQTIFILAGVDLSGRRRPTVAFRGVDSQDFMTVSPVSPEGEKMSWPCLEELSKEITKQFPVGAFVYDVTDKPPATTEWE